MDSETTKENAVETLVADSKEKTMTESSSTMDSERVSTPINQGTRRKRGRSPGISTPSPSSINTQTATLKKRRLIDENPISSENNDDNATKDEEVTVETKEDVDMDKGEKALETKDADMDHEEKVAETKDDVDMDKEENIVENKDVEIDGKTVDANKDDSETQETLSETSPPLDVKKKRLVNDVRDTETYLLRDEESRLLLSQIPTRSLRSMIPKKSTDTENVEPEEKLIPPVPVPTSMETTAVSSLPPPKASSVETRSSTTTTLPPLSLQLPSQKSEESKYIPAPALSPPKIPMPTPAKSYAGRTRLSNLKTPAKSKISDIARLESPKTSHAPMQEKLAELSSHIDDQEGVVIEEDESSSNPLYTKTHFWILMLLLFHVTFSKFTGMPFLWETVPSASVQYSDKALSLYQNLNQAKVPEESPSDAVDANTSDLSQTCVDGVCESDDVSKIVEAQITEEQIEEQQKNLEREIEERMISIAKKRQQEVQEKVDVAVILEVLELPASVDMLSSSEIPKITSDLDTDILEELLDKEENKLKTWEAKLEEAEKAVEHLEKYGLDKDVDVGAKLEDLSNVVPIPVATFVFDGEKAQIPGEGCDTENTVEAPAHEEEEIVLDYLPREEVEYKMEYVAELAQSITSDLITDEKLSSSVHKWVEKEVATAEKQHGLNEVMEIETEDPIQHKETGMPTEEIKSEIKKALEIEAADGTGKRDYASVRAGASVIRKGNRKTSPSLVDNLPIGNRILAALKLRFYGHQAEAALSVTHPKYALGQCWSFEPVKGSDEDDEIPGKFGSLSVNLSDPIHVKSVMIEHPPKELTSSPRTAIKAFRVIGYQDEDAAGYPWDLGSFTYDIGKLYVEKSLRMPIFYPVSNLIFIHFVIFLDSPRPHQEFEVATNVFGNEVPLLRSVTLAIDSNWGEEYSCLYRFRVHGM